MTPQRLCLPLALIALCLISAGKRDDSVLLTIHLETSEDEYPKFAQAIKMGEPAKQYYFQILPVLTNRDVAWFYPFISEDGVTYGTAFKLNKRGTDMLKSISLTPDYSGKLMVVNIAAISKKEPAVKTYLEIDRPISDGIVVVWGGLSDKHLRVFTKFFPHVRDVMGAQ